MCLRLKQDIARTSEGEWLKPPGPAIKDLSLSELKTYDVGRLKPNTRYSRRYPEQQAADGERIPTLGEVISLLKPGQPGASPWMAGIDIDDLSGSIPRAVKAAGGRYWAPYYKHITHHLLKEAHELGLQVFVWTPDSRQDMKRLIEMGVDGIITNRPDILKTVIGKDI